MLLNVYNSIQLSIILKFVLSKLEIMNALRIKFEILNNQGLLLMYDFRHTAMVSKNLK